MYHEGQIILFRSFKIHDKWYEGVILGKVRLGRDWQYSIKTDLKGIHKEVLRYEIDIKEKK
jgi:hypothetical protein